MSGLMAGAVRSSPTTSPPPAWNCRIRSATVWVSTSQSGITSTRKPSRPRLAIVSSIDDLRLEVGPEQHVVGVAGPAAAPAVGAAAGEHLRGEALQEGHVALRAGGTCQQRRAQRPDDFADQPGQLVLRLRDACSGSRAAGSHGTSDCQPWYMMPLIGRAIFVQNASRRCIGAMVMNGASGCSLLPVGLVRQRVAPASWARGRLAAVPDDLRHLHHLLRPAAPAGHGQQFVGGHARCGSGRDSEYVHCESTSTSPPLP